MTVYWEVAVVAKEIQRFSCSASKIYLQSVLSLSLQSAIVLPIIKTTTFRYIVPLNRKYLTFLPNIINYFDFPFEIQSKYRGVFSPGIIDSSQTNAGCKQLSPLYSLKLRNVNESLDPSKVNNDDKQTLNKILDSNTTRSLIHSNAGNFGKKLIQNQEKTLHACSSPAFRIN